MPYASRRASASRSSAAPRFRVGLLIIVSTSRGHAAAAPWRFRGDESRRRRGRDVDLPWRRVAATPRGYAAEASRKAAAADIPWRPATRRGRGPGSGTRRARHRRGPGSGARLPAAAAPDPAKKNAGYGKNKLEWVYRLRNANYTFRTVPGAFATHAPHAGSASKEKWALEKREDGSVGGIRRQKDELFRSAVKWRGLVTPFCRGTAIFHQQPPPGGNPERPFSQISAALDFKSRAVFPVP